MPGLTTRLAGFVAVFGKYPLLQFKLFQAVLGCACLYLIFLIGRKIFGTRVGLISAAIMALYAPSIYVTGTILTEVSFYFLFLMTFLYSVYAIETSEMKYYILGGVFLGLAVLFRPTVILFPIVILAIWMIKKYRFKDMVKFAVAVIGVVSLILMPWIIRNAVLFGEFIPLTKASGNPAFQGTFINYDQSVRDCEGIDYYKKISEQTDIDVSKYGCDERVDNAMELKMTQIRFKEVILKQPLKYLNWYTVGKTIKNFHDPFLWVLLFNIGVRKFYAQHYILLAFGIAGFAFMTFHEKKKGIMWLPALTILWLNSIHLPYYCFARYMFPSIFCLALYSGYLLDYIKRKFFIFN